MGIVFGITGTKGPEYAVLFKASGYELRKYPGYVTAEVAMIDDKGNNGFGILAKYIGVFGKPENTAVQTMDMTHPVIFDDDTKNKQKGQAMAMTHPVIFDSSTSKGSGSNKGHGEGQAISMTSPVINNKNIMKFVLPSNYQKVSQVPKPTDKRVVIKEVPEHYVAVSGFSGWYTPEAGAYQLKKLIKLLKRDEFLVAKSISRSSSPSKLTIAAAAASTAASTSISSSAAAAGGATAKSSTVTEQDEEASLQSLINSVDWQVAQYHPPFTLPFCRLNEIWIKLNPASSPALKKLLATPATIVATSSICASAAGVETDISTATVNKASAGEGATSST